MVRKGEASHQIVSSSFIGSDKLLNLYLTNLKNPLKGRAINWLHFAIQVQPTYLISDIWAHWRSALSARVPECQKLKM